MTIVRLADALAEEIFGGKAASLARAAAAGLPVPDGFAVSWEMVAAGNAEGILAAYRRLSADRVAVRSSAVGEDSAGASFAGQHATILNVASEGALIDAVQTIRASAHAGSALAYRKKMGIEGEPRIAVVVQKMVDADVAGVLFTRNPVTGEDERVIESAWGLGEVVVAGLVTPDRFRVSRDGAILERAAGRKDIAIRRDGEVAVPAAEMMRLSLTDQQLLSLHQLASRCETFFGAPQDLEWAIEGGELHLLQSRPITRAAQDVSGTPNDIRTEPSDLTPRRFAGLALAALLAPLNSTIIAVALPSIAGAFDASAATATRVLVTAYLVVTIVAQSPAGKLADLWGTSRVLTLGRTMFGLGALVAAFSPTLLVLGGGRVLMAIGGALSIPTVFAQLRNSVPPEKRGRIFGIFGAIMSAAAAAGPVLGGLLTERFGWHSVFFVNVPVVLLSFFFEPPVRRPATAPRPTNRFDFLGSALLGIAVILLVAAVERTSMLLTLAALVALGLFIARELRVSDPVLDVRLFNRRAFAAGSAIVGLQNLAMYSMLFLLPFFLARGGTSPSATGAVLLLFTISMVLASPVGGRLSDAIGARSVAVAGAVLATLGAALFVARGELVASVMLMGAGIGMTSGPSNASALSAVPAEQAGVAAGALSTMRYAGGVIGSGLVATLAAGAVTADRRLYVFPAVLLLSALASLALPGKLAARTE